MMLQLLHDIQHHLNRRGIGKNFRATRLREKDDSFVKNELFHLLTLEVTLINKIYLNSQH